MVYHEKALIGERWSVKDNDDKFIDKIKNAVSVVMRHKALSGDYSNYVFVITDKDIKEGTSRARIKDAVVSNIARRLKVLHYKVVVSDNATLTVTVESVFTNKTDNTCDDLFTRANLINEMIADKKIEEE